ncbi:tetratricopeptide repeat protein, partial [Paludisphaera mucosa]
MADVPAADEAAGAAYEEARYEEALDGFRSVLEACRRWLGERHPDTATSYNNIAAVLLARGDPQGSDATHRKGLSIRLAALGERHPDVAESYNNLAEVLRVRGDLDGAEAMHRKALDIRLAALGERHPDTSITYSNLAALLHERGDLAGAETIGRKVLEVRRAALGENHPDTATSYNILGRLLRVRGDLAGAEAMIRKALAIQLAALGERHVDTAIFYDNLSVVLQARGDLVVAEAMSRRGLAIWLATVGESHSDTAASYNILGCALAAGGNLAGAEETIRKGLAIRLAALGERHPDIALSDSDLAWVLHERGDSAGAEAMYRKALAIRLAALGERHPLTTQTYTALAWVLHERGDSAGAEEMIRKAVAIRVAVLGESHPYAASSYRTLGAILADLDRPEEAIRALEAAEAGRTRRPSHRGLEDATTNHLNAPAPLLCSLLASAGRPAEAWDRWERGLGRALLDEVAGRAARPLTPEERREEAELLARAQSVDDRIGRLLARSLPPEEVERTLEALRREGSDVRRRSLEMQTRFEAKYGPLAGRPASLEVVRAMLNGSTALVGWVDVGRRHWACVVRQAGEPAWVPIPGGGQGGAWTDEDDGLAGRLREALASPASDEAWRPLAEAVARQRLAPIEPHLRGVLRVIVLTSPGLAGVPVESLFAARNRDATSAPSVGYAPSASMLAHLAAKARPPGRPATLLALGDPAYPEVNSHIAKAAASPAHGLAVVAVTPDANADLHGLRAGDVILEYNGTPLNSPADIKLVDPDGGPGRPMARVWRDGDVRSIELSAGPLGVQLDDRPAAQAVAARRAAAEVLRTRGEPQVRLPGTRREVAAIAALFPEATTILGDQARESTVQAMARSGRLKAFRFLHLAAHGRTDPRSAFRTALILAPDPDRPDDPEAFESDGEITAEQIARTWELDADLVVLSACESGLGKAAGGEGLLGFAQPLLVRGARSLVLSLWKVDDDATALLMTRFYRNLLGGRDAPTAPMP